MFSKILLAYDGSANTEAGLRQSADLARLCNAELHLLGVVDLTGIAAVSAEYWSATYLPGAFFEAERGSVEKALEAAIEKLGDRLSVHTRIREGGPAEQIAAHAQEIGADLVVIGHSDKGFLVRLFEGSTGADLIRNLPCSLLVATTDS